MKVIIAAASLLASTAMAMPALSRRTDPVTYAIEDFTYSKENGVDVSSVTFRILATNGGTLNSSCVAYDPPTDAPTTAYVVDNVYPCGKDSVFSWNFKPKSTEQANQLYLWQNVGPESSFGGNTFFDDPPCRGGGNSAVVCEKDSTFQIDLADLN